MANIIIQRVVLGDPKPQQRARHFTRGTFTGTYDPSEKDKKTFAGILQATAPETPLSCPISLEVVFYLSRPKNHYRTGKNHEMLRDDAPEYHSGRPDVDNLVKFVQDSLNGIYYRDDALISELSAKKYYSERPRTEIFIRAL